MTVDKCNWCGNNLLDEMPGQAFDFDADEERHGSLGIPLCSHCLGTGNIIDSQEFKALCVEVGNLRGNNFGLQINCRKIKNWRDLLIRNNRRLVQISQLALKMVDKPVDGCYAIVLGKPLKTAN